jgi:putative ubiquitin-RnfH superfamily antitoxin RatB of RatAB toxin-antitoxin module
MSGLRIEVVYALPDRQVLRRVSLPEGSTVGEAVRASGFTSEFPEIDLERLGIFGESVSEETVLRDRDRVELYRPLRADPKDGRRARAARKRAKSKA